MFLKQEIAKKFYAIKQENDFHLSLMYKGIAPDLLFD